ncbi:hypothetical protein [Paenibacillus riograndensis]|uniref:Putative membrane protein n=1 Tax=Paenibacillus riograndensis SBR5 TaxID=1073571 RepID=A0A0E4H798_9BACL|nr:hypothetical protein [Paenibacillus riograndensis]CQR53207.1 putative membrane protein [Paenibacillus riograndensis SBR5]
MERQGISIEEENVKKMSGNEGYDDFDVKDRVMLRIREIHARNLSEGSDTAIHGNSVSPRVESGPDQEAGQGVAVMQQTRSRHQRRKKPRSRTKIAASGITAALILLAAGFGIYQLAADYILPETPRVAVEIIESKEGAPLTLNNSTGKQILQTARSVQGTLPVPSPSSAAVKYNDLLDAYKQQAESELGPGEKAVFYIKDAEFEKLANGLGESTRLFTVFRPLTYSGYDDFSKAWSGIALAGAPLPSSLPGDFGFAKAQIIDESSINPATKEYQTLLQALKAEAEADSSGKKVFVRKLEGGQANNLAVTMDLLIDGVKRSLQLRITPLLQGSTNTINILSGQSAEKWLMEGKEALFISGLSSGGDREIWYTANRLIYYNEAANATYIWTDAGNPLDKSEWQALASGFIQ